MDCPCKTEGQGAFFLLWPLFARAPRHWFLENFLLSAPGVQSVFFFVALRWAPRPFGGARAKKKHPTGWCFFLLLRPRADAHSLTAGLGGDASPSPGRCFFFCCGRGGVFFLLWPRRDAHSLTVGWGDFSKARVVFFFFAAAPPGPGWCFFFCCGPARTLTHSLWAGAISARPGWCFFFCCGPAGSF